MEKKVIRKQYISKNCLVCGTDNKLGLHTHFYELENGELVGIFEGLEEHQSYPGRMHGGMSAAILDETIGRVISIEEKETWGVTIELQIKYRKPVPLGKKLKVVARLTKNTHRSFEGEGEILLEDGTKAVTAKARYMKLNQDQIVDGDFSQEWFRDESQNDVDSIELP